MLDYLKKIANQTSDFFIGLSPGKKVAMVTTLATVLGAIGYLFYWAGTKNFRPLQTNLSPEDSASIQRILREKKIPFQVDASGRNISIPPESVYDLRLELATMGLPQSDSVGYEVFDKQSLGTSSFVQNMNSKRALEGELMRTITTMHGVRRARVHLAIPKKSPFVEDQKNPTASVVLDLNPGLNLNEKQIFGIGHLVASAVEGLDISSVVIVDSNGKVLSKNNRDSLVELTSNQADFRRKLEESYEKRIEDMFGKFVGEGRVVASVSADLDFSQLEEAQTVYDADGAAIVSVQKHDIVATGSRPGAVGAPGARANTPGEEIPPTPQIKSDTNNNKEIVNYKVPETVRRMKKDVGKVKKLSVAVVVDGKPVKTTDKDGKVLAKSEPWAPEKLKEFEGIVSSALGLDIKRGDTIQIKNMEFSREDFDEAEKLVQETERRAYFKNLIVYSVIAMLIILFFVFVVRPFIKWITENTTDSVDTFLPQTVEELEKIQKQQVLPGLEEIVPVLPEKLDPEKVEGEMIKEKIVTLIDTNPKKAAMILRDWIKEEPRKRDSGAQKGA